MRLRYRHTVPNRIDTATPREGTGILLQRAVNHWSHAAVIACVLIGLLGGDGRRVGRALGEESEEPQPGLTSRPLWTSSKLQGTPEPPPPYRTRQVFPHVEFENPVDLIAVPGSDELLVVELGGRLQVFSTTDQSPTYVAADFSQLPAAKEVGKAFRTYGFAFHPNFAENGLCYVCYVLTANDPQGTRVSRFRASATSPLQIDLASEEIVISWLAGGHNGGSLQFGPQDGYLYISTGDGAPAFPPDIHRSGQDISDLLASVLRIDVDHKQEGRPYRIPDDNPFVATPGARGEVWTYGHRNPWRMSFDPVTGELWIGDVGWEMWEMIYRAEPGANFGWSMLEHTQPIHPNTTRGPTPITPPAAAHSHIESRSITGGYVYRGDRLGDLQGTYIYGDYVTGKMWGLDTTRPSPRPRELADTGLQIICFGVDHQKELYIVSYDGTIHQLIPQPRDASTIDFPRKLSETGLFASTADHRLATGVIPYAIIAEPWADGTVAQRFIALPGTSRLGTYEKSNIQRGEVAGQWSYPEGAVLGKTIQLEVSPGEFRRIETQIFHRYNDAWEAYNYIWNDQQTDAQLSLTGSDRQFTVQERNGRTTTQTWHSASQSECILCHTTRRGSIYGFRKEQLNRDFDYGGVAANQLQTLAHIGLFANPIDQDGKPADSDRPANRVDINRIARVVSPLDESESLDARARSYLHLNCATCHCRGGGGSASIELVDTHSLERTRVISRPTQGTFGLVDPWIVAPGDPLRSVLYYRMIKLGRGRMPHFGSQVVDSDGVRLIHHWIQQLEWPDDVARENESDGQNLQRLVNSAISQLADATTPQERLAAADRLLASTSGAVALARLLRTTDDGRLADQLARHGSQNSDAAIRDLFEPFLPAEARTKRLGGQFDTERILHARGDFDRGKNLFLKSTLQCRNCHSAGSVGGIAAEKAVGPDLQGIGKRLSRREILTNILDPSRRIDPKYQTWLLETADGQILVGLLVEQTPQQVAIRDDAGKTHHFRRDDVEALIPQQKSLMPESLLKDSTVQDAADLLKFLEGL